MQQKAKFAICAAFKNGYEIVSFILDNHHDILFVATCDKDDSIYENKISELCSQNNVKVIRKINASSDEFINTIESNSTDLIFLAWWPSIISKKAIASANIGWINLHPSLLPYNRGKHPYYWSIIDGTPFGVTLHFIDAGTDTGDILYQEQIDVLVNDTGESLYKKGDEACLNLFKKHFEQIVNLKFKRIKQDDSIATMHFAKDIIDHSRINLDLTYNAKDLINIIRARTFWSGDSAYFYHEGKKYLIRTSIDPIDE